MNKTRIIEGLSEIAPRYEGFILDLWGCLHDGVKAFPPAVEAARKLKEAGGRILVLSNAPRRASEVTQRCLELGIDGRCYHDVLSSGEDAWRNLKQRKDPWYQRLGRRCYHLGPERDHGMRDGQDLEFVANPEEADFILNTGADQPDDSVETYASVLEAGLAKGLPMTCANPDLEVIRGGRREICAGAIAQRYQELGGDVRYHGKPYAPIYESARSLLGIEDPAKVLCIGDALRTDVAGANLMGMGSLWILDGIHGTALGLEEGKGGRPEDDRLEAEMTAVGQRADYGLSFLRW